MTKDKALDLALDALESCMYPQQKQFRAITAIKQALALDKKAENAKELGLDYEPVWCGHCNGSGRMVRDPDIGTDQECFVCDGAGVPAAPVQEPYKSMSEHIAQATSRRVCIDPITGDVGIGTPAAQSAPVQEPVANLTVEDGRVAMAVKILPDGVYDLYTTPPAAQPAPVQEPVAYVVTTEVHGQMCSFIHRIDLTKLLPDGAKLYTTPPPAQPAPVQEPVALELVYETIIQWDEGGGKRSRRELARRIVDLYTTPPAAQRQWVWLTDEDIEQEFGFIDELLRDCVHRTEAKVMEKNL